MPAARQSRHTKIIYRNRDHLTALFADSGLMLAAWAPRHNLASLDQADEQVGGVALAAQEHMKSNVRGRL
jgi:hypothetical protein